MRNGIDIAELVRDALAHLDGDHPSMNPFALPPPPPAASFTSSPPPPAFSSRPPPPPATFTSPPPPDSTGAVELPAPPSSAVRLREALAYSAPPPPKKRRSRGRQVALLCTALGVLAAVTAFFGTSPEARTAILNGVTSTLARAQQGVSAGPSTPVADVAPPVVEPPVLEAVAWQPSGGNHVWAPRVESPSFTRAAQPAEPQAAAKPQAIPQPAPRPAPPPVAIAKPVRTPVASAPPAPPTRSTSRPAAAPKPAAASDDDAAALEMARQAKANLEGAL